MAYGPRPGFGTWLTLSASALAVLAPIAWAVTTPQLSRVEPIRTAITAPPRGAGAPRHLIDQLDALPIVVADLPDAVSRRAAARYAALRLGDADGATGMFNDAWGGLSADASAAPALAALGTLLLHSDSPAADLEAVAQPVVAALSVEPRNGDRLSNAAVALLAIGLAHEQDPGYSPSGWARYLPGNARALLELTAASFPANRVAHLNLAFLTDLDNQGCGATDARMQRALSVAGGWLADHPGDVTARLLVASLQARDVFRIADSPSVAEPDRTDSLGDAVRTLQPLLGDPATAPLGSAGLGDAYLAASRALGEQAPYLARRYAQTARSHYDRALSAANDPGLLAGEAMALDLAGDGGAALAALERAVEVEPGSAELQVGLAAEQERVGAFEDMKRSAERALALSLDAPNQLMQEFRLAGPRSGAGPLPGDAGYLGLSIGRDRPRAHLPNLGQCGGFIFSLETNPIPADASGLTDDLGLRKELTDSALGLAIAAATVLGDSAGAAADVRRWRQQLGGRSESGLQGGWLGRFFDVEDNAGAPAIAAGQAPAPAASALEQLRFRNGFETAEALLTHAGAVSHQPALYSRAAALCRRVSGVSGLAYDGALCEATSAYYAGDRSRAASGLERLSQQKGAEPQLTLEAAFAWWRAGDQKHASRLLQQALAGPDVARNGTRALANELTGELLLDQAQPTGAIGHFEQARQAARDDVTANEARTEGNLAAIRVLTEHASNDHGVALLWSLQRGGDAPPDCTREAATCAQARDDFRAALAIDPADPIALQNLGWTERLLGHLDVARTAVSAAVQGAPGSYPALNDLGWLQLGAGDRDAARRAFQDALALRPDDDIAAWNLGMLSLESGPPGLLRGEAYLARAMSENPGLREHQLDYRTDDRIYRQLFGSKIEPVSLASLDEQLGGGALAVGTLSAASAVASMTGVEIEHTLTEVLRDRQLPLVGALLRRVRRRRGRPATPVRWASRLAPVMRWTLTGAILAAIAIWTAWPVPATVRGTVLTLTLAAAVLAVLVHEAAHLAAACLAGIRLRPVWPGRTIVVSLALLPFGVSDGPFPGHEAAPATPFRRSRWVYLAGPLANVAVAVLFYVVYRAEPLPALRLLAEVQLGAAAFSLLPLRPLDAAAFGRHRADALLLVPLALVAAIGGYALRSGAL